jgi:hypothetical protein
MRVVLHLGNTVLAYSGLVLVFPIWYFLLHLNSPQGKISVQCTLFLCRGLVIFAYLYIVVHYTSVNVK